jgi:serine-type D-Ala-D-Ala endopeptidase (penicillin-binding protein 7)
MSGVRASLPAPGISMKFLVAILMLVSVNAFSRSHILYDAEEHVVVTGYNYHEISSVASLTKLMTAMVYIDTGNYKQELLEKLLIRSDNLAAETIAKEYNGGKYLFVKAMNRKADNIGLVETFFHDPSGLSVFNRSTAREYVDIVLEAEKYPLIRQISSTAEKTVYKNRKSHYTLHNTNIRLLKEYDNIALSKTGFTSRAGRCLALFVEQGQGKYVIIILGERTPENRQQTAKELIKMIH